MDILNNELTRSTSKFGFVDLHDRRNFKYKLYQDNDPKDKPLFLQYLCHVQLQRSYQHAGTEI